MHERSHSIDEEIEVRFVQETRAAHVFYLAGPRVLGRAGRELHHPCCGWPPPGDLQDTRTTAKTAILYVEKHKPPESHQVLLAEVAQLDLNGGANPELDAVVTAVLKC